MIIYMSTALVNNLKACSPMMYRLYTSFKDNPERRVTQEDIDIASGAKPLDASFAKVYFKNLELASENLQSAFAKQVQNAAVRIGLLLFDLTTD